MRRRMAQPSDYSIRQATQDTELSRRAFLKCMSSSRYRPCSLVMVKVRPYRRGGWEVDISSGGRTGRGTGNVARLPWHRNPRPNEGERIVNDFCSSRWIKFL